MESLSQRDFSALSEALRSINALCKLPQFRPRIVSAIGSLFSSDITVYNEVNTRANHDVWLCSPEDALSFPDSQQLFDSHIGEHPLICHYARTGDERVFKISDFLCDAEFQHKGLYQDFFRIAGTRYQMAVTLSARSSFIVGIALNRKRHDFSERERLLLSLIRPHLVQAYRNVQAWTQMADDLGSAHRALDELQAAVIVLRSDSSVLSMSTSAQRLLEKYFDSQPKSMGLPALLRTWVKRQFSRGSRLQVVHPLRVNRGGAHLTVRTVSQARRIILLLNEHITPLAFGSLQALGLTLRETEVLAWVARGRSNLEIAELLNMSARTVQKHLEHIFQKIGVESRTAAAARVWNFFNISADF